MLQRWRQFRRNARTVDVVKTALFLPVFMGLAFYMFQGADYFLACALLIASFGIGYLAKSFLVRRLRGFLQILNVAPVALTAVMFLWQDRFLTMPVLFYVLFVFFLGALIGAFFWGVLRACFANDTSLPHPPTLRFVPLMLSGMPYWSTLWRNCGDGLSTNNSEAQRLRSIRNAAQFRFPCLPSGCGCRRSTGHRRTSAGSQGRCRQPGQGRRRKQLGPRPLAAATRFAASTDLAGRCTRHGGAPE